MTRIIVFLLLVALGGCQNGKGVKSTDIERSEANNVHDKFIPITINDDIERYLRHDSAATPDDRKNNLGTVIFGLFQNKKWKFYSLFLMGNTSSISTWTANSPRDTVTYEKVLKDRLCFDIATFVIAKAPGKIFDYKTQTSHYDCDACVTPIVYFGYSNWNDSPEAPKRIYRDFYINTGYKNIDPEIAEFAKRIMQTIIKLEDCELRSESALATPYK